VGISTTYPDAAAVLARYPLREYPAPAPFYAMAAVFTDSLEACRDYRGATAFASQVPTWEEEFDDPAFGNIVSTSFAAEHQCDFWSAVFP
jgi:hypothetical protein